MNRKEQYIAWLKNQRCLCGNPVNVIDTFYQVPYGICDKCENRYDLARLALLQLARFSGMPVRYRPERLKKLADKQPLPTKREVPELSENPRHLPYLVAAEYIVKAASTKRPPSEWLSPEEWCRVLNTQEEIYRRLKHYAKAKR